ncbi:MAG: type II toxin-antitoxin system VapC family toxin [Deltaproteobacteria bacterium]|nr:type II toxin-antitoxin system VapC family toxin [Deltaproteobacteria bacterium]
MKLMLDTSAYVGFKRCIDAVVEKVIAAEAVLISPIMLGELFFGFRCGNRFEKNIEDLNAFLAHEAVSIVEIGTITADRFSRIAVNLKKQGTPIPSNDIWIAAQTMEHGAELITLDHHFEKIPGLVHTRF